MKKVQIYTLLSMLVFYFFFLQRINAESPATPEPQIANPANLIINEFSPKNTEHDWIELYVIQSGSIKGLKVYDDKNFVDVEENIIVNQGDYILIYFKADENLIGYNGDVLVIQNTKSGLTATTEQIILKNYNNEVIDFVCWRNSTPTTSELEEFNNFNSDNWASNDISTCFDSESITSSDSVGRNSETDSNSIDDWQIFSSPTPGGINIIEDKIETIEIPEIEMPELNSIKILEENLDKNIPLISDQKICTKGVVISEIFPNPSGNDSNKEWIELFNNGSENCFLEGWSIDDGPNGSSPYFFQKTDQIFSGGYFLAPSWITKINLNNSEDMVRLYKNGDEIEYEISYKNAPEDESFSLIENEFFWTQKITPLIENIFYEEIEDEKKSESFDTKIKENIKTTPNGDLSNSIIISEIFPNPKGTDKGNEWIEIYNDSNQIINLGNWSLDTGLNSKIKYIFPNVAIDPQDHLLILDTEFKFSLKNSNGEVRLLDYNEEIVNSIEYEKAEEEKSYSRIEVINDEEVEIIYEWTENISPDEKNPFKNKITGEIIEFDEISSKLQIKSGLNEEKISINVLNDGASDLKNIFIKGAQISALTTTNEDGGILLEEYEVLEMPIETETNKDNNLFWLLSIPFLIIMCALGYYLIKKYKIINFKLV